MQKRRIDLITIGDPVIHEENKEDINVKGKVQETKKRVVLILARTHGGEPPSSIICQGFLDYIISSSEKAISLRNSIMIQVVPMLNPDGVFLGNQRSDLLGSDLNRCWNRATTFAHPALIAVNELIKKITAEKSLQLDFIIDIHADISHEGVFVRGNSYDDVYRFERHAVLPKFLAVRVESWKSDSCLYNTDPVTVGSARRTLPTGAVDAYSLLASLGGRRLSPRGPYMHYTEDAYAKIGRSLVKALCDYYRHIGVISPLEGISTKKKDPRRRRRKRKAAYERERSPSSSPERRVLVSRVLSPPLPAATPPPRALPLPPRTARCARPGTCPRALHPGESALPVITGKAVHTPKLTVVDLSAYVRTPVCLPACHSRVRLIRSRRRLAPTSDEYDTHDSDT